MSLAASAASPPEASAFSTARPPSVKCGPRVGRLSAVEVGSIVPDVAGWKLDGQEESSGALFSVVESGAIPVDVTPYAARLAQALEALDVRVTELDKRIAVVLQKKTFTRGYTTKALKGLRQPPLDYAIATAQALGVRAA